MSTIKRRESNRYIAAVVKGVEKVVEVVVIVKGTEVKSSIEYLARLVIGLRLSSRPRILLR